MIRRSILGTVTLFALTGLAWQLRRLVTSQPRYAVERRNGPFEIRQYRPRVVAHIEIERDFIGALHEGYQLLARFAQGENDTASRVRPAEPFTATPAADATSYVIAMEMPVRHEPPRPTDPRVKIDTTPVRRVATLRFRGATGAARVSRMKARLLEAIKRDGLVPAGETSFATYDVPGVLPFLRRNEVWVEI